MVDGPPPYIDIYSRLKTIVKGWTYLKSEIDDKLSDKLDKTHTSYKGKNVVTNSSTGAIEFEEKNNHTHSQYLTEHQSLTNYVQKSNTNGLLKNDGTVDTNTYLTGHQDISGKEDTSNKTSGWNATTNNTRYPTEKLVKDSLDAKLDKSQTSYKGKNVVVDSTTGNITFEDKNNHTHSNYLTSHQDITGKEDKTNKSPSITTDTGSTTKYPTVKAVEDYAQPKGNYLTEHQSLSNYVTTDDSRLSDARTPTTHNHNDLYYTETETDNLLSGKSDNGHTHNQYLTSHQDISGKANTSDLSTVATTGSYTDLSNKPSYTATVTSSTNGAYKIGSINISGSSVDIYGKDTDTHQSLTNYVQKSATTGLLTNDGSVNTTILSNVQNISQTVEGLSTVASTGNYDDLDNKPSIPSDVSELSDNNNTAFTPKSHTHGIMQNNGVLLINNVPQTNKNVVTGSGGGITVEDKISASNSIPPADTTSGSYGSGTSYARSNHTHPKSTLYAESSHTHNIYDLGQELDGSIIFDYGNDSISLFDSNLTYIPSEGRIYYGNGNDSNEEFVKISDIPIIYELTSSTYNATIDTAFTITVKATDILGYAKTNKSVTLYHNGTSVSSQNTDSNGVATWSITPSTWGIHDFNIGNIHCQVDVSGWKNVNIGSYGTLKVNGKERLCYFTYYRTNFNLSSSTTTIESNLIPEQYSGGGTRVTIFNNTMGGNISDNGTFSVHTSSTGTGKTINASAMWKY